MPVNFQKSLAVFCKSLFSCKAKTVARLQGVLPTIKVLSSLHKKCSDQTRSRGLKSLTCSKVKKSKSSVFMPLLKLHCRHASHKFSSSVSPPLAFGNKCSNSSLYEMSFCGTRQYPQRCLACLRILCSVSGEILLTPILPPTLLSRA